MADNIIGILAGVGHLPIDVAEGARAAGYKIVGVGVVPGIHPDFPGKCDVYLSTHVGKLAAIFKFLHEQNVKQVTLIGKVTKEILYSEGKVFPDWEATKLLFSLRNRNDDSIMLGIVERFGKEGIVVMNQLQFLQGLMPEVGIFSRRKPSKDEWEDMDYGLKVARQIGGLDIGQTVVVKKKAVIAVEAIEGTDACIRRAGGLAKETVVCKTAKPHQDKRFDVPCVGPDTIRSMIEAGSRGLVMEAGKTIFVNQEEAIALANEYSIVVAAKA